MARNGFYFDMTSCSGCRTCQIACKDKNNLNIGVNFRRVRTFEGGKYPKPWIFHFADTCNHCSNPKCVEICPTNAMYIANDKTVQLDEEKCIGCKLCMKECPYEAIKFIEDKKTVGKCNMCKDITDKGGNPVCVDSCPMRALEWGNLDKLKEKHKEENVTADISVLPPSNITNPSLLINPKAYSIKECYKERNL